MAIELILRTETGEKLPNPSEVVVSEKLGQPINFTLTFAEDVCKDDFSLLNHEGLQPLKSVSISVKPAKEAEEIYLVKGFIQGNRISLKHGGEGSQLQIGGMDNLGKLSWETRINTKEKNTYGKILERKVIEKIFENKQHTFDHLSILTNADKAVEQANQENPDQKPKPLVLRSEKKIVQNEDDLAFLKKLADQYGMKIWLSYDEKGKETAHFDTLPLEMTPEIVLNLNSEKNKIDEFDIVFDINRPTLSKSASINRSNKKVEKVEVDSAPQHKLGNITLKDLNQGFIDHYLPGKPDNPGKTLTANRAALNDAEWFIKANCATSYERLCKVIRAHTIIRIEGVGSRHSGNYLVAGVTHNITAESYKMKLDLQRNAWFSPEKFLIDVAKSLTNSFKEAFPQF